MAELTDKKPQDKWYFKTHTFIVAFLCIGPLALPLIWFNPLLSKRKKVVINIVVLFLSYLMWILLARSLRSINSYYQLIFQEF